MGDGSNHSKRGDDNFSLGDHLSTSVDAPQPAGLRWAVVAYHYAAREWIHAFLADRAQTADYQHPGSHRDTMRAIVACLDGTHQTDVRDSLQVLSDMSNVARYLEQPMSADETWFRASYSTPAEATDNARSHAVKIRAVLASPRL